MAITPIFKDGLPLFIGDSGTLKPAENENECACCGPGTYNYCACSCQRFQQQIDQITVTSTGFRDWVVPPPLSTPQCGNTALTRSVFNGSWTMAPGGNVDMGVQGVASGRIYSESFVFLPPSCNVGQAYFWRVSVGYGATGGSPCIIVLLVTFTGQVFRNGVFVALTQPYQFVLQGSWNSKCAGTSPFYLSATSTLDNPITHNSSGGETVTVTAYLSKSTPFICP